MGIGIGGGFGPLRGGVSTRGFGGRVGPVSAGTGWSGCGTVLLFAMALAVLGWLVDAFTWPYRAGVGLVESHSAGVTLGVVFEALFLAVIATPGVFMAWRRRRASRLADARHALRELEVSAAHAQNAQKACKSILNVLAKRPDGVTGVEDAPDGHRVLFAISPASLLEPRVAGRGGPKVPTEVDTGKVMVTDRAVVFVGENRQVEWRHDKRTGAQMEVDSILFSVSNRKTITGVGGAEESVELVEALVEWADHLGGDLGPVAERFRAMEKHYGALFEERWDDFEQQGRLVEALGGHVAQLHE